MFFLFPVAAFILLPFSSITAQERIGPYMAYSWQMGLSGGLNSSVCDSPDGFLWIATGNGLIKFDGRHYQRILAGPASIPDNVLMDVATSADGRSIWIGSLRRGVARFDLQTQKIRSWPKLWNHNSHVQSVPKILCLNNGQVWLATKGMGLALFSPQLDSFLFYTPEPQSFYNGEPDLSYNVKDMTSDPSDSTKIWLICNNKIYQFDTRFREFTPFPLPSKTNIALTSIAHDDKDGLWLGTWGASMFHYNIRNKRLNALPYVNEKGVLENGMLALDVEQLNDTTVLWACALSGLLEYNPKSRVFKQAIPSFKIDQSSDNRVEFVSISKTKNAGVFIGAKGNLFQLHPYYSRLGRSIYPAPWAPQNEIYTNNGVFDKESKQYIIPTAGPLSLLAVEQSSFSSKAIPVKQQGPGKGLKDLTMLASGKIIALGFDGKLLELNAVKNLVTPLTLNQTLNTAIIEMKVDKKGYLWLLTKQNLFRYDPATLAPVDSFSFPNFENPLDKPFNLLNLYQLETTSKGHAWVGSNQGLWYAEPDKQKLVLFHPENKKGKWLKDKLIKSLAIDEEDRLWVGYNGDGLDIFDTKKFEPVNWPQGSSLNAQQMNDLACTPGGYVLAPTTEGLLAVDRKTLDWQLFGTEDGLFSQFMDKDVWAAPDGMVFINHGTRLNIFHESVLAMKHEPMKVNILRFTVNNVAQDLSHFSDSASYLSLPFSSNNIAVSYSAMHWLYPFKTQYIYRFRTVSGHGEWVSIEEPFIQLNALRPGQYIIDLAAKGAGGIPSLPKVLYLEIRSPFWVKPWFILLFSALFGGLFYTLYRFRLNQLRKQLKVRDIISKNLHDDIGSSLSNIQILTELANRNLDNREKADSFLKRSGEDIRRISEALSEIVWNVNPKYDDLQHLFARMRRYAAESFEGMDIQYKLDFPEESIKLKMGMEQRRDFYLIFKESIHNLVKYSAASLAQVNVEIHQYYILLEVKDNGVGFLKNNINNGNGLISMQQRAEKWKGKFIINSAPGLGTSVQLSMPLK